MLNFLTLTLISFLNTNREVNDYTIDNTLQISRQSDLFPFNFADSIFFNGTIITMVQQADNFSAVAIKGQLIIGVGNFNSLKGFINQKTRIINLKGLTLTPGFYDAHSHFSLNAVKITQGFDISSPPIGKVTKISEIIRNIKKYIKDSKIPAGETIYGMGYNDVSLEDKRLLTKQDLDQISTEHFILLFHSSGHIGTVNTKILQKQNITNQTKVRGGFIGLDSGGQPNGILKQTALFTLGMPFIGKLTKDKILAGQQQYFKAGYTTAQDVITDGSEIKAYLDTENQLKIDIDAYQLCYLPSFKQYYQAAKYQTQHFRVKGIKTFFDGSIQAYTAALSKPYYVQPEGTDIHALPNLVKKSRYQSFQCTKKWCGGSTYTNQSMINEYFNKLQENDIDTIVHCNGDVAVEQFIRGVKFARKSNENVLNYSPFNFQKTRFILNHAQTATEGQLKWVKKLDIALSLFPAQTYFWGDVHRDRFLGPVRAARICPAKSALENKIKFTLHSDAPVTPLDPYGVFQIIWSAVNRITLTGKVLGPEQKISVYEAMKAVTINAAWQGREEQLKGSIQVGKRADFVILSANPLKVDSLDLRNVAVVSTYKNGELVYNSREWISQMQRSMLKKYIKMLHLFERR